MLYTIFDRHRAQAIVKARFRANGPPVVKKHFQRTPHRHPPADEKTFSQNFGPTALTKVGGDGIANGNRRREKHQAYDEADSAISKQSTQIPPRARRPLREELVNRLPKQHRFVGPAGRSLQMDDECERRISRKIPTPVDDELFRSRIEVTFTERRRIDGIEQLPQLGDPYLNELALRRNGIPGRHWFIRHQAFLGNRVRVYAGTGAGDGVTVGRVMPAAA